MVKIGIFGARRGGSMIEHCNMTGKAKVVAVCDGDDIALENMKNKHAGECITYYADFDSFLTHDMDAVVIANSAHEHAPYSIRCLDAGKHVLGEVVPCQNMREAAELVEAVERSGKLYAYAENYCYMPAAREMKKLYMSGKLGEFEYGEGEYLHNTEYDWPNLTYGQRDHWRNAILYATFYCTHSLGPVLHATGLRPVEVTGFELPYTDRCARMGRRSGIAGMEIVTLENGGIVRSIHGALDKYSVMYRMYGSRGRIESAQDDARVGGVRRVYVNLDRDEGDPTDAPETYLVDGEENAKVTTNPHEDSDRLLIQNFIDALSGERADIIDVYAALDMFLPGLFAWFSVLDGGKPKRIPDLRDKAERDKWRNDVRCTDKNVAGDRVLPAYNRSVIEVPDAIYDNIRRKYLENNKEKGK